MGVIGDPTYGQLLVAHDERATLWTAETTATSATTQPGRLASLTSAMVLACAGSPTLTDGTSVRCQRPGYPDAGASIAYVDGSSRTIGWDAPTSVQYVETVAWDGALPAGYNAGASACVTTEDKVVVAVEDRDTSTSSTVKVGVRATDGTWYAWRTLVEDEDADNSARMHPTVVAWSGKVRLYMWRRVSDDGRSYLTTWEADESADLTTSGAWSEVAWDGYQLGSASDWPESMSIAYGGGQWSLVYSMGGDVYQLASRDGLAWSAVATLADYEPSDTRPRVIFAGGAFILAYAPDDATYTIKTRSVGSAFTAFSTATAVTVLDQSASTGIRLSATVDDAGRAWLLTGGGELEDAYMWCSEDGGQTWRGDGQGVGRRWAHSGAYSSALTTVTDAAPVWWRDRMLIIHRVSPDANAYENSILCAHMGGRTSYTLPQSSRGWRPVDQFAWLGAWWAGQAQDSTWVTATGSAALDSSGPVRVITCDPGETYNVTPGTGVLAENGGRWVFRTESGDTDHQLQATDGTNATRLRITSSATGFSVYDDIAGGAAKATVANTGILDVIAWVRADGEWRVFYGNWTSGVRTYTALTGTGLTTAASAASQWSFTVNPSTVHKLYLYAMLDFPSSSEARDIGRGVVRDWSTPARVGGRPVGGRPVYLADGLYVYATRGPAVTGETWTYTADAQYHVRQAEWTPTYPSPRTRWRSTVSTSEAIAYKLGDDAVSTLSPVWGLVYTGTAQRLSLSWHDGSSWGSDTNIDLGAEWEFTRTGSTLIPTGAAETGPYVQEGELVGGFAVDPAGRARRITANTAGVLGSVTGLTWQKTRITLALTGSESSGSNDWRIFWPTASYIFAPPSTAKGVRVRFGVSSSYRDLPESYHDGKILIGPAYYLGLKHGQDSTRQYDTPARTASGESGLRYTGRAAPSLQTVTLTWQSTLDRLTQARGAYAGGPDYEAAWSGGDPAYTRGGMESTIRGLVERWSATGQPVAYIPSYTRSAAEKHLYQRAGGLVVGTLDPTWTVEHVGRQDEQRTDVVRLGALTITELR